MILIKHLQNFNKSAVYGILKHTYEDIDNVNSGAYDTFLEEFLSTHYSHTNNKIVIYGAGSSGKSICKYAKICGLRVDAIACSDEYPKPTKDFLDIPVYYISELPFKPSECSFVIASEKKFQTQIKKNLLKYNYYSLL